MAENTSATLLCVTLTLQHASVASHSALWLQRKGAPKGQLRI